MFFLHVYIMNVNFVLILQCLFTYYSIMTLYVINVRIFYLSFYLNFLFICSIYYLKFSYEFAPILCFINESVKSGLLDLFKLFLIDCASNSVNAMM